MTGAGGAAFAMPAPRPTALNPSAPTVAAPAAIFVRNIAKTPFANPQRCATLGSLNSCPTVRDLVRSTTKRWVTHPHPHCPNAAPTRRRPSPRRPPGLPRPRRRPHHVDVPHMRSDGVRDAAQHTLQRSRWACDGADLNHHVDPICDIGMVGTPGCGIHHAEVCARPRRRLEYAATLQKVARRL